MLWCPPEGVSTPIGPLFLPNVRGEFAEFLNNPSLDASVCSTDEPVSV